MQGEPYLVPPEVVYGVLRDHSRPGETCHGTARTQLETVQKYGTYGGEDTMRFDHRQIPDHHGRHDAPEREESREGNGGDDR